MSFPKATLGPIALDYSKAMLIAFLIYGVAFIVGVTVLHLNTQATIKLVKIVSLVFLVFQVPKAAALIEKGGRAIPLSIQRWMKAIRIVAAVAAVSIFLSALPSSTIDALTKDFIELARYAVQGWYALTKNAVLINLLALLPIALFPCMNFHGLSTTPRNTPLHRHFLCLFGFVDAPCIAAVAMLFFVVILLLPWGSPSETDIFLSGAAAVVLFISSAMTVSVDCAALHYFYIPQRAEMGPEESAQSTPP